LEEVPTLKDHSIDWAFSVDDKSPEYQQAVDRTFKALERIAVLDKRKLPSSRKK